MLVFIAPYELYMMNMADKEARFVVRDDNMISDARPFNIHERIVYTNDKEDSFYFVNFNGSALKKIDIQRVIEREISK